MKRKQLASVNLYDVDGSLTAFIERLNAVIKENPNYEKLEIEQEREYGYYEEVTITLIITGLKKEK